MTGVRTLREAAAWMAFVPVAQDRVLQLVLASPTAGREHAFDQWYAVHLREFVRIPGVISARRSKLVPLAAGRLPLPLSMAICELQASAAGSLDAEVARCMEDGSMTRSDAVNHESLVHYQGPTHGTRRVRA